jgi:hypothetical protein
MKDHISNDRLSSASDRRSFLKGIAGSAAILPILPTIARSGSSESYGHFEGPVEVEGSSSALSRRLDVFIAE